MPQWGPFLGVTVVLLVLLLVLARLSQRAIHEYGSPDEASTTPSDSAHAPESRTPVHESESRKHEKNGENGKRREKRGKSAETRRDEGTPEPDSSDTERPEPSGGEIELTSRVLMANVAFTQGLVIVILLAAAWYFAIPADAFGLPGNGEYGGTTAVAAGVGFGVVLWVANELSTTVADAVGAAYDEAVREMLAPDSAGGWVVLFGAVLPVIAVSEELLFRAALIGVPAAGYDVSVWLLAVLSSVAFAFGHGAQGRVGVVVTGALGFVLAAGYVYTGSLVVVIVAHYVINALEFLVHELLEGETFTSR